MPAECGREGIVAERIDCRIDRPIELVDQGAEPEGACRGADRGTDVLIRAATAPLGWNNHSPLRPNHTPTSALSATNARKPLTITNSAGGKLLASGRGGRDTGLISRQTPATKQKAANITNRLPVATIITSGRMPLQFLGSDAARESDQARAHPRGTGPLCRENSAVTSENCAAVGRILDALGRCLNLLG